MLITYMLKKKIDSGEIGSVAYIFALMVLIPGSGLDSFVNFAKNSSSGIYHDMADMILI